MILPQAPSKQRDGEMMMNASAFDLSSVLRVEGRMKKDLIRKMRYADKQVAIIDLNQAFIKGNVLYIDFGLCLLSCSFKVF